MIQIKQRNVFKSFCYVFPHAEYTLTRSENLFDLIRSDQRLREYLKPRKHLFQGVQSHEYSQVVRAHNLCGYKEEIVIPEWFVLTCAEEKRFVRKTQSVQTVEHLTELINYFGWSNFQFAGQLYGELQCELIDWCEFDPEKLGFIETSVA